MLLAIAHLLAACDYSSREASGSPLWGGSGFNDKTTYVLVDGVFLLSVEHDGNSHLALSPSGEQILKHGIYNAPRKLKLSQLDAQKSDYMDGRYYNLQTAVLGVVRTGTRLKVVDVHKERKFSWFFGEKTMTTVHAEILDGEYRGRVADIRDISLEQHVTSDGIVAYKSDPTFLQPEKSL